MEIVTGIVPNVPGWTAADGSAGVIEELSAKEAASALGTSEGSEGASTRAIKPLSRFVSSYPRSARLGEAAARLGWLLLDAGAAASPE